jgi:hypothetical protein
MIPKTCTIPLIAQDTLMVSDRLTVRKDWYSGEPM